MRLRRWTILAGSFPLAVLACGGGGGDSGGPAGPVPVENVQLTASASTVEVGNILPTSVTLTDRQGRPVTGRQVTYQSSAPAIATVDNLGTVLGVSPGSVTITATAEGKSGSLALTVIAAPVANVVIDPRTPTVRQGASITLTARAFDAQGRELTGRSVTWASASAAIATVSASGVVTGVAPGSVFISASSEGKRDSVSLRVRSLLVPTITSTAPATWTPGSAATIDGTNFSTTLADNEVYLNGARAAVTAATATRLTITVPAATALPCTPNGATPLLVVVNGDSASATAGLRLATARTLNAGEALLLTAPADVLCNEFAVSSGTYLITAFNYDGTTLSRTSFTLQGSGGSPVAAQVASAQLPVLGVLPPAQGFVRQLPPEVERRMQRQRTHLAQLEADRQLLATRQNLVRSRRAAALQARSDARLAVTAVAVPNVGDMLSLRMRINFSDFRTFETIRGRVVYVGPKMIIVEDSVAPLARSMDAEYQRLGQEFDRDMYGFLTSFGDPLAVDSLTDKNGRIIAVFSPRVNRYGNGNILGFVTICDFFDNTGPPNEICPSSNIGEYFYAIVPDPNAQNGFTVESWRRFMRGTLIHEAKHIAAYAERLLRDTEQLEESWLEEATAQQATELWARFLYRVVWKDDSGWNSGPRCDYAPAGGGCPDPAEGILGHFVWLYQYYDQNERRSILSSASADGSIYGSAWSFARWVTDAYAVDEARFLRSLVQVRNDFGVANITSKSGKSFAELLGYWSLASTADNYPGVTVSDGRLQLASWNSRDLFLNMHQFLRFSDGRVAFPKAFPLTIRFVQFGTWSSASQDVLTLPGGSFAAWNLSGMQNRPQAIGLRAFGGGAPPPNIGLAIMRVN